MTLAFRPIDLDADGPLCATVRAETFAVSFGSDAFFWAEAGPAGEHYLAALRERMRWNPGSCVWAWRDDQRIGMLELKPYGADPSVGYINTFSLFPAWRGQGLGAALEAYVASFFASLGIAQVRLTVSPRNERALAFYRNHGWREIGALPFRTGWLVHYNKAVPGAAPECVTALSSEAVPPDSSACPPVVLMEKTYEG